MTYKSMGVHKNRDNTSKMKVEAMDRDGVTDSSKQAAIQQAASVGVAKEPPPSTIGVDERIGTNSKDTSQEVTKSAHKSAAKFGASVEPGQYLPPSAPSMDMGSMMGGGGGGGGGGEGGGEGGSSWGGSGESGGGGGGMDMSGAIGESIAGMDDTIDAATDKLFEDDTDIEGHQALGEELQGR